METYFFCLIIGPINKCAISFPDPNSNFMIVLWQFDQEPFLFPVFCARNIFFITEASPCFGVFKTAF